MAQSTTSIEQDATTSASRSAAPGSALAKLLEPVDNRGFQCGLRQGWDTACLNARYQGPPADWPRPTIDQGKSWQEMAAVPPVAASLGKSDQARLDLGAALFFDPGLSHKGKVSCASCHKADKSFSDGMPLSVGEDQMMGRRRAQTLFAAPFAPRLFWDGRAPTLGAQSKGSITNPFEMNNSLSAAVAYVNGRAHYFPLRKQAFGHADISEDELVSAIARYVQTIRPPQTLADQVIEGKASLLNVQQLLGLHLFRTKARCMNCHSGPLLTDHEFHDLGLSFYGRRNQDLGRFEVTREKSDLGKFRTPSLRGVSHAGPWMHNGLFQNLPGLIRLYNGGMGVVGGDPELDPYVPTKSPHIQPLQLNASEIDALVEWLKLL